MSGFLAAYGLWLLIALLVIIILYLVLTGPKGGAMPKTGALPAVTKMEPAAPAEPVLEPVSPSVDDLVPPPVEAPVKKKSGTQDSVPSPTVPPVVDPAPASTAAATTDNLLLLKGVGPKLNTLLIELGVTRFAQIAAWTDADLSVIDAKLGSFRGRPVRDHWIDQARYLAAGDTAGFEAKYGKL